MSLAKAQWSLLIPHQGAMCLLDEIVEWTDTTIHARSDSHRRVDNPLRRDDRLRAVHLCEYGAQAMAVHGALLAQTDAGSAEPGMLVSLRAVEFAVTRIDDLTGTLDIHAERLAANERSCQCAFRIEHRGALLAQGRAAVMLAAPLPRP